MKKRKIKLEKMEREMKKNEIYEGTVNSLKFPNKGRVFVPTEEENVMVKNTLPGQKVQFRLVKNKKNKKI